MHVMNVVPQMHKGLKRKVAMSRDLRDTHLTYFCIFWYIGLAVNPTTKLNVYNFTHFRDTEGSQNFKSRSRAIGHASFNLLLHVLVCRPGDKFEHQI